MAMFGEAIATSGTYATGGITLTVSKANAISNVYAVTAVGGYLVEPVSFSGKSITVKVYVMPATATAGPLVEQSSGGAIPSTIYVLYEGY